MNQINNPGNIYGGVNSTTCGSIHTETSITQENTDKLLSSVDKFISILNKENSIDKSVIDEMADDMDMIKEQLYKPEANVGRLQRIQSRIATFLDNLPSTILAADKILEHGNEIVDGLSNLF